MLLFRPAAEEGKKAKGKKAKAPAILWDWDAMRSMVVRPVASALELDLKQLYRLGPVEEDLLNLALRCTIYCQYTANRPSI